MLSCNLCTRLGLIVLVLLVARLGRLYMTMMFPAMHCFFQTGLYSLETWELHFQPHSLFWQDRAFSGNCKISCRELCSWKDWIEWILKHIQYMCVYKNTLGPLATLKLSALLPEEPLSCKNCVSFACEFLKTLFIQETDINGSFRNRDPIKHLYLSLPSKMWTWEHLF